MLFRGAAGGAVAAAADTVTGIGSVRSFRSDCVAGSKDEKETDGISKVPSFSGTITNSHVLLPSIPCLVVLRSEVTRGGKTRAPGISRLGAASTHLRFPRPFTLNRKVTASPSAMLDRSTDESIS